MTLSEELAWRGFINQTTYKDVTALDGDPITFYWGVDPSANSMQHGQLDLRVAKLSDTKLIAAARKAAQEFIDNDEKLSKYPDLNRAVTRLRAVTNLN